MTGRVHIEDDWYLIPDEYSWNLCRRVKNPTKKKEFTDYTYHATPEQALKHYQNMKQRKAIADGADCELREMIGILSSIQENLHASVLRSLSEAYSLKTDNPNADR